MSETTIRMCRTSLTVSNRASFAGPDRTTRKERAVSGQVRSRKKFVSPVVVTSQVA